MLTGAPMLPVSPRRYHRLVRRLAELAEQIAGTTRTSVKVAEVAAYLRSLSTEELPVGAVFLSGRPFPERDARTSGVGWAQLVGVAERVVDAPAGAVFAAYTQSSDIGTAVFDLFSAARHEREGQPPTLLEVADAFARIASARGQAAKAGTLDALFRRCDPLTAKYVTRILAGELRIGLREGHLEAAIASAFERPQADVQWAGMLTGDIGRTAVLARNDALASAELTLFHPLKSMLASPVRDEAEALGRMAPPVWVE